MLKSLLMPLMLAVGATLALPCDAQTQAPQTWTAESSDRASNGSIPRMADGHPDLSGVWWRGTDIGGGTAEGGQAAAEAAASRSGPPGGPSGMGGPPGGPPGMGGPSGGAPRGLAPSYTSLYKPEAAARAAELSDEDDPTLRCIPTAFGTLGVRFFDAGALGQIVSTPELVVTLSETYHGYQIIPTDGRPHRDFLPPSWRGDSVGHWEGDTFVVETRNFTDDTWIFAEGRVSIHSDALRIVERYRRLDEDTLQIEATIEDPEMLTKPWVAPTQTLRRAPFDHLLPLNCVGAEGYAIMQSVAEELESSASERPGN